MPLWLLLLPYAVVLTIFIVFSLFNFGHLLHYGFFTFKAVAFLILYSVATLTIFLWTTQNLSGVDWTQPLIGLEEFGISGTPF